MLLPSPLHHAILSCWFYFIFRLGNSSTWHCPRNPVYSACLYRLVPIFRSNLSELVLLRSYQLFFFYRPWRKLPMTPHLYSLTFKMLLLSSHALHFNKRRKILRENSFWQFHWILFFFFCFFFSAVDGNDKNWAELVFLFWQTFSIENSFFLLLLLAWRFSLVYPDRHLSSISLCT